MKRCILLFTAVFGLLLCCGKSLNGPEQPVPLESGRGAVAIQFTAGPERTVFPSTVFSNYTYTFTKMPNGTAQTMVPSNGFFYLETGEWKVQVNAYVGAATSGNLAATGERTFTVVSGTNNVTVGLAASQPSGNGTFTFTVGVPSGVGAGIVRFNLTRLPDTAVAVSPTPGISNNAISGTQTLSNGFYLLEIVISRSGGLWAGITEVVCIYPRMTTEYTKAFTADDFSLRTIAITYNLNGFPGTAPGSYTAASGMAIGAGALPALTVNPAKYASLYTWQGWATTANGTVINENQTFSANQTLYAIYTPPHNGALVNGDFTGTGDAWGWEANDPDAYSVNATWGPSGGAAASLSVWGESSAVNLNLYQNIRNLETGLYTLSAKVIGTGYTSATNMYARTYSGASPVTTTTPFTSTNGSTWVTISIANVDVTDGYLTAGFNIAAPAQTWIGVAHVTLVKQQGAPQTTKSTTNRNGQTIAQLASAFDATANTCTVSAIDNINTFTQAYRDDYIRGVDISAIIEVENNGGVFYDNDRYLVGDVIELLSYYGINWVRVRLWHNPYTASNQPYGGGTNDYAKAVEIAKRAKKWGMKVLLDIHYSDFWTHPGQQAVPKAWQSSAGNVNNLATLLKAYTKQVLADMYAAGALPDMVQVGNETTDGFCGWKDSASNKPNEKILLAAGLAGVREISTQYNYPIRTMLHATGGMTTINWYFGVMQSLDFDILGLSYYPQYHGNLSSLETGLQNLATTYRKPICVVEYSVAYTSQGGSPNGENHYTSSADTRSFTGSNDPSIQGQASAIRNLNNAVMNNTVAGGTRYGIGSFWWEPAWLPLNGTAWALAASGEWYRMGLPGSDSSATSNPGNNPKVTWANQAFFSFTGTALPSLNAFLQMMGKPARPSS